MIGAKSFNAGRIRSVSEVVRLSSPQRAGILAALLSRDIPGVNTAPYPREYRAKTLAAIVLCYALFTNYYNEVD